MGTTQSTQSTDTSDSTSRKKGEVEEMFVQKVAYKCGVTEQQLDDKREKFKEHAGSEASLGFQEFKALYQDISGRQEDAFLNTYVESVFRAFDANQDAQLSWREWQVGFYLLLLLPPTGKPAAPTTVSKEEFLLALEIIFRLYDQDGNGLVTDREIRQVSSIIQEPEFRSKFDEGVLHVMEEVDAAQERKSITLDEFLKSFSK